MKNIRLEKRIPPKELKSNLNNTIEQFSPQFQDSSVGLNDTYVSEYQFVEPKHPHKETSSITVQEHDQYTSFSRDQRDMKNWSGEYSNLLFPRPTKPFSKNEYHNKKAYVTTPRKITIPTVIATEEKNEMIVEVNESFILPAPNTKKLKRSLKDVTSSTKKKSHALPVKGRVTTLSGVKNNPKMFSQNTSYAGGVLK